MIAKQKRTFRDILRSKPVLIGLGILLIFVGSLEFKQLRNRSEVNKEIAALQKQEQELVAKNKALQDSLEYFNNDAYREKVARQQLNLKKDGEVVVNFPANQPVTDAENTNQSAPELSNPQKWWNFFFIHSH